MHTPHKRNAPGANRGVPKKIKLQLGCTNEDTTSRPDLQALETMADWKESLDARFQRAQLEYGLVGKDSAELRPSTVRDRLGSGCAAHSS